MAVYQREPSMDETVEVFTEYATPTHNKAARSLKDVPRTVVPLIPSNITGTPKPQTSPSYPKFKLGMNEEQLRGPAFDDLSWLLVRHYHRNRANPRKLSFLDLQFQANIIQSPGPFHVVLCALLCLGAALESSGLDEAWIEAGLYSSVTVVQILNRKHHNRALDAHQITLQVLFDLWIEAFSEQHPVLLNKLTSALENVRTSCQNGLDIAQAHRELVNLASNLKLVETLEAFDHENEKYPMYKWARIYMRQISNLLQFMRGTRDHNLPLYLASLEKMCVYFFAYNRHDYAQNIPDYIAHMYHLESSHPSIWQELKSGDFVVSTNPVAFTSIGPDHAQEHVNKIHKGEGAISGLTTDPQGLLK